VVGLGAPEVGAVVAGPVVVGGTTDWEQAASNKEMMSENKAVVRVEVPIVCLLSELS
jgi:hypothetical protein